MKSIDKFVSNIKEAGNSALAKGKAYITKLDSKLNPEAQDGTPLPTKLKYNLTNAKNYVTIGGSMFLSSLGPTYSALGNNLENEATSLKNQITVNAQASSASEDFDIQKHVQVFNPYMQTTDVLANGEFPQYSAQAFNDASKLEGANEDGVSKRRAEKIEILNYMLGHDNVKNIVGNQDFNCDEFSNATNQNFAGWTSFETHEDYAKYMSKGVTNSRFGIPVVSARTHIDPDKFPQGYITNTSHEINAVHVGHEDPNIKDNHEDFYQYYYFEPQTGKEVKIGDWNMNKNGSVIIEAESYAPYPDGTNWEHRNIQLVQYDLVDGTPTLRQNGVNKYIITENPLRMNPRVVRENDADEITVNYSANIDIDGAIGEVSAEADTEHYQDRVGLLERKISEPTWQSSDYPNRAYNVVVTEQAQVDVGMNPVKSPESKVTIKVRDIESPVYDGWTSNTAKADFGTDPLDLARDHTGSITDNSNLNVDTVYTTTEFPSRTEGLYNYFDVQGTATDKFGNETDMGTFEAGIRMFPVGINEAEEQRGFDIEPQYSARGVNLKTFASERGNVSMKIFNMSGQLVKQEYFGANQGMEKDVWMNNFTPGTYVVRGTLKTKSGEFYIDTEEIFIGCCGF